MCYRYIDKVFGTKRQGVAGQPAGDGQTVRVRPAKVVASVRRQADQLAFTGFLARLQRRLVEREREDSLLS